MRRPSCTAAARVLCRSPLYPCHHTQSPSRRRDEPAGAPVQVGGAALGAKAEHSGGPRASTNRAPPCARPACDGGAPPTNQFRLFLAQLAQLTLSLSAIHLPQPPNPPARSWAPAPFSPVAVATRSALSHHALEVPCETAWLYNASGAPAPRTLRLMHIYKVICIWAFLPAHHTHTTQPGAPKMYQPLCKVLIVWCWFGGGLGSSGGVQRRGRDLSVHTPRARAPPPRAPLDSQ